MRFRKRPPVDIGWFVDSQFGDFVFPDPVAVKSNRSKALSERAVQACPAVNELERRLFQVTCPFHIELAIEKNDQSYDLFIVDKNTRIDRDIAGKFVQLMDPAIWRSPDVPVIQLSSPYVFFSDEVAYLQQLAPSLDSGHLNWPGLLIPGRFPIQNWMRPLNWAFEWVDVNRTVRLRQGQPLYYVQFETERPADKINLVRAQITDDVRRFQKGASGAPKFVSNTFRLMDVAAKRRKKKLLVPE